MIWSPPRSAAACGFSTIFLRLRQLTADLQQSPAPLFHATNRHSHALGQSPGHAAAARNACLAKSAGRRNSLLSRSTRRRKARSLSMCSTKRAPTSVISPASPQKESLPPANVPEYWFYPPISLPTAAGINRFVWDLRYPHPRALPFGFFGERLDYTEYTLPDHAVPGETPRFQPPGPLRFPRNLQTRSNGGRKILSSEVARRP